MFGASYPFTSCLASFSSVLCVVVILTCTALVSTVASARYVLGFPSRIQSARCATQIHHISTIAGPFQAAPSSSLLAPETSKNLYSGLTGGSSIWSVARQKHRYSDPSSSSTAAGPPQTFHLSSAASTATATTVLSSTTTTATTSTTTTVVVRKRPFVETALDREASRISLFCFAWTPRREIDLKLMPHVKQEFAKCNDSILFSDKNDSGAGIVGVSFPPQNQKRTDRDWLYHRNMVGLLPSWTYLVETGIAEKYDWVINIDFDHFMSPARVRLGIATYLSILRNGTTQDKRNSNGSILLMFGNAFVFNRQMVQAMRRQWSKLGEVEQHHRIGIGCPAWRRGKSEWPNHCSQDLAYPQLAGMLWPPAKTYGSSGCGQADDKNGKGQRLPLMCFQCCYPFDRKRDGQEDVLRTLSEMTVLKDIQDVEKKYKGDKALVEMWQKARQVAVIHYIDDPDARKVARQFLPL